MLKKQPNIVLLGVDSLRADHMSCPASRPFCVGGDDL
jgi:hypothetical protein